MLPPGQYRTPNGSEMTVSGKYGGISEVSFAWLEEGCCIECHAAPYDDDGYLVWDCEECGGGRAEWKPLRRGTTKG